MTNLLVERSSKFVSLDTHPSNNALVVTYEILVIVIDTDQGQELTRRSKRDQFQVKISALDGEFWQPEQLDLDRVRKEIVRKCPMLSRDDRMLEEIKLNLMYLFNRKQHQSSTPLGRPLSSASVRLKSERQSSAAPLTRRRTSSVRPGSRLGRNSSVQEANSDLDLLDIYDKYRQKELRQSDRLFLRDQTAIFVKDLDSLLHEHESRLCKRRFSNEVASMEIYLEGLYGEPEERLESMSYIRGLVNNEGQLATVFSDTSGSNLLVCALLRTLRDCQQDASERTLYRSILYCLLKFTENNDPKYDDDRPVLHNIIGAGGNGFPSAEVVRIVAEILEELSQLIHTEASQESAECKGRSVQENYYELTTVLIILGNFLSDVSAASGSSASEEPMLKKFLRDHSQRVADCLSKLFAVFAKPKLLTASEKYGSQMRFLLSKCISLALNLSRYKIFINGGLRLKKATAFCDRLVQLLDVLQVDRSQAIKGKGADQLANPNPDSDLYELEIDFLRLIINLTYDQRLNARLMKRRVGTSSSTLLKCVLKNLVCFAASEIKNRHSRAERLVSLVSSQALLVPFKCLYELSRSEQVKEEIFRSKIVLKCLLDFLLNSGLLLRSELMENALEKNSQSSLVPAMVNGTGGEEEINQIVLRPTRVDDYILALWINLSSRESFPLYKSTTTNEPHDELDNDSELHQVLRAYLDLSLKDNLPKLSRNLAAKDGGAQRSAGHLQLITYLHSKLVRNIMQFVQIPSNSVSWSASCASWVGELTSSLERLLLIWPPPEVGTPLRLVIPLAVEHLAVMSHLLSKEQQWRDSSLNGPLDEGYTQEPARLIELMFTVYLANPELLDPENDDLIMVSLQFIATLAKSRELCQQLSCRLGELIRLGLFVLQSKSNDSEMILVYLSALEHSFRHSSVLNEFVALITGDESFQHGTEVADASVELIDRLSLLLLHGDANIARLANSILDKSKRIEEQLSLNDSLASLRRFEHYNSKWFQAIRANRDEPTSSRDSKRGSSHTLLSPVNEGETRMIPESEHDHEHCRFLLDDDLSQLRSVGAAECGLRDAEVDEAKTGAPSRGISDDEEDEEEDDEISSLLEPDANVIDANSMIMHLADRKTTDHALIGHKSS